MVYYVVINIEFGLHTLITLFSLNYFYNQRFPWWFRQ